ncbi:MAG: zf-HC2 domain-containing protein [Candidatus Hydrogenedentota bacterium]
MHEDGVDDIRALISGYLDGELTLEERGRVERLREEDPAFREEFERMKRLVTAATELRFEEPPEEVWDTFLDGVYNRIERQTGWVIFLIGVIALAAWGIYCFWVTDWGSALVKVLIAAPIVGLVVLFGSVLRQRLFVARADRYSKEIKW